MPSTKEKVIALIREILPDTMALTFGCEVENLSASLDNPNRIGLYVRQLQRTGLVNAGSFYELKSVKGKGFYQVSAKGKYSNLKILGHPITLTTVLRAIEKVNQIEDKRISSFVFGGYTYSWNLSETLENQKPEVHDFLLTILEK